MVDTFDTPEVAAIKSRIQSWLDKNENKFELDLTKKIITLNRHYGSLFTSDEPQVAMTIAFEDQDLTKYCSIDELRSSFCFIALDRLAIPGLEGVPSEWEIYPQTPISSFSDGVTLEEYDSTTQILELSIQTEFVSLYGYLPQTIRVANRPIPKTNYLQIRRDIQGDIRLRVKLVFK